MTDDPFDFSSLDPYRDPARFERGVQAVMAGLATDPMEQLLPTLVRWGRVAVLVTAALALCIWLPSLSRSLTGTQGSSHDPVQLLSTWAERGEVPLDVDPLVALGGGEDAQQ